MLLPAVQRTAPSESAISALTKRRSLTVVLALVALAILSVLSLFIGSGGFTPSQVFAALTGHGSDSSTVDLLIREYRVPRTVIAILVGASLGAAGTIMQALTRNPLADPGILGVNAGAYTAVVFTAAVIGPQLRTTHVLFALLGALAVSAAVYIIGTRGIGGRSPAKLVLTGVALGAVLSGVSYAVTLLNPEVFDRIRYWNLGSLQGRQFVDLQAVLPFIITGLVIALFLPRSLNTLAMGDDLAIALGAKPLVVRIIGVSVIALLCGSATAVAGPIAFVGLLVPHLLRLFIGPSYTWLLPLSIIVAPVLLLGADIAGRLLVSAELPAGIVTALIGAPVLIYLARKKGVKHL